MDNKPKHIAVIVDGNRRYAKKIGKIPWKGHESGADKLKKFIEWCNEEEVEELTLYLFSMQNFNRDKEEVEHLLKLFNKYIDELLKEENLKKSKENGVRIRFIGKIEKFPIELQEKMQKLMKATQANDKKKLNFAMAYGGREEIVDTAKRLALKVEKEELKVEDINEEMFNDNLWLSSSPDLIIRTSGECRTSNFLPWQSTYSEWFFLPKTFPEIEKSDLQAVIKEYTKNRERRFGK